MRCENQKEPGIRNQETGDKIKDKRVTVLRKNGYEIMSVEL
jgi:hypothetical protein